MTRGFRLECRSCGRRPRKPVITCPYCGGIVEPVIEIPKWKPSGRGVWRYLGLLPRLPKRLSLAEGQTPILEVARGEAEILVKDEGRNPTGSFRDRAAAVVVSHALSIGAKGLCVASDGNMAASASAYAALGGLRATVVVPVTADPAKIAQSTAYGASLVPGGASMNEAVEKAVRIARRRGLYNATAELNPLSITGLATIAYEVVEEDVEPDYIVIPTGSGLSLYSMSYGFKMLTSLGLVDRMPKLVAAVQEYPRGPLPMRFPGSPVLSHALRAAEESGGKIVSVTPSEMRKAVEELARKHGILVEPAAGAAYAAALKAGLKGRVLVILTSTGLKTLGAATGGRMTGLRSTLKKSILAALLRLGEAHGYRIWREIGTSTPQAVYRGLRSLEAQGLVYSRVVEGKRIYGLTKLGRIIAEASENSLG